MNKNIWIAIIILLLLLPGSLFILSSRSNVSALPLSTSTIQLAASPEYHTVLKTVTLDVPSMTCASCPFIVEKTLRSIPGVTEASADFETKTATVVFDKDKTNISVLLDALKNRGYLSSVRDNS